MMGTRGDDPISPEDGQGEPLVPIRDTSAGPSHLRAGDVKRVAEEHATHAKGRWVNKSAFSRSAHKPYPIREWLLRALPGDAGPTLARRSGS